MIVTDRFVFLHLHKSGGRFIAEGLRRHLPAARAIGYHLPARFIPPDARALPVLGLVRNPWSYYVSWFSFQRARPRPNALFRLASDEGRLDFKRTIHRLLDLGRDDALLGRAVAALPDRYGGEGLNLPGFALAAMRGTGLGFYSWLYGYLHAGAEVRVARLEHLATEAADLFAAAGAPPAFLDYLRNAPPLNRSDHAAFATCYDATLRDRVAAADAPVIDRHGYSFG